VLRSAARNLLASVNLDAREYRDEASGTQTDRKTVHAATFAVNGDATDDLGGAGGFTLWGVFAVAARIDLAGDAASQAADQAGPRTEGGYGKFGFNLARLQHLDDRTALWAALSGQLATRNLDSSEKFALGGAYGVRAYPALEAQGDSGWLGTLEIRRDLRAEWQAFGFVDAGGVQRHHDAGYPGASTQNRVHLAGAGFGLNWARPGDFNLRATIARRLGSNPLANPVTGADTDGSHETLRLWLVASKAFP
jgi:hemolysin activation/secretion protein